MHHTDHTLDIILLRTDKDEFILRCQRIVKIVVKHFIKNRLFSAHHIHDIIQSVNEELIKRLPSIEKNFNGKVLLVTYMNVVIRNICLDIHDSERHELNTVSLETFDHPAEESEIFRTLNIDDELHRLIMALKLYNAQAPKIIICLKIYFRLPVTKQEINECFTLSTYLDRNSIFTLLGGNYDERLEVENFNIIAPSMNRQEGNTTSGASLRRWTQDHLYKVITILNGKSRHRSHTKETVKTLLEHYTFGR